MICREAKVEIPRQDGERGLAEKREEKLETESDKQLHSVSDRICNVLYWCIHCAHFYDAFLKHGVTDDGGEDSTQIQGKLTL